MTPADRRCAVEAVRRELELSERRACRALDASRSPQRYRAPGGTRPPGSASACAPWTVSAAGSATERLAVLLRREGQAVNLQWVYRR